MARLFEGTDGYAAGEQRRDFVFVGDVVDINLFFATGSPKQGIFNVGTGTSRSFNDIARTVIGLLGRGEIQYIPFPPRSTASTRALPSPTFRGCGPPATIGR